MIDPVMKVLDKLCKNRGISIIYKTKLRGWELTKDSKSTFVKVEEITRAGFALEIIPSEDPKEIALSIINRME